MKSPSAFETFFRPSEPTISALQLRVASALKVFVSVRGLDALRNNETAVVMRKGYKMFVTQDASAIDKRESVLAVVHVKDMKCYHRIATIQTNHLLQRSRLDRTISNRLAKETAMQLLKAAGKISSGERRTTRKIQNSSHL
jgi:hypothetical protein